MRSIANFPGLYNADDTQNDLISRGNSSYGIQYRIEDVPVENPHHFAILGATGGIFPIVNTNVLANSDFANGALSAQYGNAYAGVFDMNLRQGNNRRHEFMGQISLLGVEFSAEGPFKKGQSSYLVVARGSILDMLQGLNIDLGSNSVPQYADANLKIRIPTKNAGTFSIFGIGGISSVNLLDENVDTNDIFAQKGRNIALRSNLALVGGNHLYYLDDATSVKTTLSYFIHDYFNQQDTIIAADGTERPYFMRSQGYDRIGLSTVLNRKISRQFSIRTGVEAYLYRYQLRAGFLNPERLVTYAQEQQVQANVFAQAQYKISKRFELLLGVQGMYWSLNKKSWTVEPRVNFTYNITNKHRLNLGYGLHSRIPPASILFHVASADGQTFDDSNRSLGLLRSHNVVLSYDWAVSKYWTFKANLYTFYQTDVPVEATPSSYSILNNGPNESSLFRSGLVNEGEGYNYGAEVSIERFLGRGYYGLLTASYQRGFYKGSDDIWRNTAFDVRYIASIMGGKEFKIGPKRRNVFYVDLRFTTHGGLPYIPIDLEASQQLGYETLDMERAFYERTGVYNRLDLRVGVRLNHRKKRISHHLYVEVINLPQFRNQAGEAYLADQQRIVRTKQFGLFPNIMYQIRF